MLSAFVISFGLLILVLEINLFPAGAYRNMIPHLIFHSVFIIFVFGLNVFLSGLFVPPPKKIGVVISTSVCFALAVTGICYNFLSQYYTGYISLEFILSFASLFTGLAIGILTSYFVLKKRGWNIGTETRKEESY